MPITYEAVLDHLMMLLKQNREIDLKAEKGSRLPGSKVNNNQASGKILLCAPSNAAVYVLVRRMIAEMKLRAGEKGTLKSK